MSVGEVLVGATLTDRLVQATATVKRIRRSGYPYAKRAMLVRLAALPKGLYGSEAAPLCERAAASFRAAIVAAICP